MVEDKKEIKILVVKELPQEPMRLVKGEDGSEYNLITIEEAIMNIMEDVKQIKKSVVG